MGIVGSILTLCSIAKEKPEWVATTEEQGKKTTTVLTKKAKAAIAFDTIVIVSAIALAVLGMLGVISIPAVGVMALAAGAGASLLLILVTQVVKYCDGKQSTMKSTSQR